MKKFIYSAFIALTALFIVSCDKKPVIENGLTIAIDQITNYSAVATITPADEYADKTFAFFYIEAELFDKYLADLSDEELIASDYETILTELEDFSLQGFDFTIQDVLFTGKTEADLMPLEANTRYYIWAEFMDENGACFENKVYKAEFCTTTAERSDITFEIFQINDNLTIVPSNDDLYFVSAYVPEIGATIGYDNAEAWITDDLYEYAYSFGGSLEYYGILVSGENTFSINELLYDFWGYYEYIMPDDIVNVQIAVCASNEGGQVLSDIATLDVDNFTYTYEGEYYISKKAQMPAQKAAQVSPLHYKKVTK